MQIIKLITLFPSLLLRIKFVPSNYAAKPVKFKSLDNYHICSNPLGTVLPVFSLEGTKG